MGIRRKTRKVPALQTFKLLRELQNTSDRNLAVSAGSIVEGGLEKGLAGKMARMSASKHNLIFHSGPLRNFHPKILLGEALSLYGARTARDLHRIKDIRNECAHAIRTPTFKVARIKALANDLEICDLALIPFIAGTLFPTESGSAVTQITKPLQRFLYAATIYWWLIGNADPDRPRRERHPWAVYLR